MRKLVFVAAIAFAPLAAANAGDHPDPYASIAITNAHYDAAEARLSRAIERGSKEPAVLLNLAQVYANTGRGYAASELYRDVLTERNVEMALPDGNPAWSHDLAQQGLRRTALMAAR